MSHNFEKENLSLTLSRHTFLTTFNISKRKFHLIVEEYGGEDLPHDETRNIRKLLKGGDLISSMLAQLLLIKRASKIKQKHFLTLCFEKKRLFRTEMDKFIFKE